MAEKFKIEVFDPKTRRAEVSEHSLEVRAPSAAEEGTVLHWALQKGHIPTAENIARHRGPHIDVVRTQGFVVGEKGERVPMHWPRNFKVTEADYDEATELAYSVAVGESLGIQQQTLKAANERAGKAGRS